MIPTQNALALARLVKQMSALDLCEPLVLIQLNALLGAASAYATFVLKASDESEPDAVRSASPPGELSNGTTSGIGVLDPKKQHCWLLPCSNCGEQIKVWSLACNLDNLRTTELCESCCPHSDLDDAQCLDCGADLTEHLSVEAYDRAKAARQDGE